MSNSPPALGWIQTKGLHVDWIHRVHDGSSRTGKSYDGGSEPSGWLPWQRQGKRLWSSGCMVNSSGLKSLRSEWGSAGIALMSITAIDVMPDPMPPLAMALISCPMPVVQLAGWSSSRGLIHHAGCKFDTPVLKYYICSGFFKCWPRRRHCLWVKQLNVWITYNKLYKVYKVLYFGAWKRNDTRYPEKRW